VDYVAVFTIERSFPLDYVLPKIADELLPCEEFYDPFSMPKILVKFTLVIHPFVLQIIQILIIDLLSGILILSNVIIHSTSTIELILEPITLIRWASIRVVELTETIHAIILPLTFVETSVYVGDTSDSVFLMVLFEAFVFAVLVLFDNKDAVLAYWLLFSS
jgi:hypothetical protein